MFDYIAMPGFVVSVFIHLWSSYLARNSVDPKIIAKLNEKERAEVLRWPTQKDVLPSGRNFIVTRNWSMGALFAFVALCILTEAKGV